MREDCEEKMEDFKSHEEDQDLDGLIVTESVYITFV